MRALAFALLLHSTNALSTATLPPPTLATASTPTLALPFAELANHALLLDHVLLLAGRAGGRRGRGLGGAGERGRHGMMGGAQNQQQLRRQR